MRQALIFSGSSHPGLADSICERLGSTLARAELGKFSNGETKVQLHTSIRDQDVFIVQSGTNRINDDVLELLIMISACKSGSAKSVTAVMPYFPYSRQSKKKSHRGPITARMLANLLGVAGVNHVITIDLHASQMQGFFHCPLDNLVAEPLLAHWIKINIPDWRKAVVVSKNPGGTKRVTSLADVLKLDFGIIMTGRRRTPTPSAQASMRNSVILERHGANALYNNALNNTDVNGIYQLPEKSSRFSSHSPISTPPRRFTGTGQAGPTRGSPLCQTTMANDQVEEKFEPIPTAPNSALDGVDDDPDEDVDDPLSRDIVTGRLVDGHIVDDDDEMPSPSASTVSAGTGTGKRPNGLDEDDPVADQMMSSVMSSASSVRNSANNALGGSVDATASSDEEEENLKNPEFESTVTLVGSVRDRPVFIVDDMIDKSASWIAAAETVVKRGGATRVYCMATHGLFGGNCLKEMEECDCIDTIVVTNSLPIPPEKSQTTRKLLVLDVSHLLAEAIRRNHYGESISRLFQLYD